MHQLEHIKKSAVIKRSIIINGHKTSVSLEDEFYATSAIYRLQFACSFSTVFGRRTR